MREIVHIQAGQCGNQIGAKVCIPGIPALVFIFILDSPVREPLLTVFTKESASNTIGIVLRVMLVHCLSHDVARNAIVK